MPKQTAQTKSPLVEYLDKIDNVIKNRDLEFKITEKEFLKALVDIRFIEAGKQPVLKWVKS